MFGRIVAESLIEVPDLLRAALEAGPARSPAGVAATLARTAMPRESDDDEPPPWLRPEQHRSFRRAVVALRRFGGALLADPVGSGKTFVALATVTALDPDRRPTVLAPAVLVDHWERTGAELRIELAVTSHERISRGDEPPAGGPVIIDESHRFRTPTTRRYTGLAPLLIGRSTLLVSATPVVNRMDDLAHQLLLAVRDDALCLAGVGSLRTALGAGEVPPALASLVISDRRPSGTRPRRREVAAGDWSAGDAEVRGAIAAIGRLRLSRDAGVAALVRYHFLRALASSPAALAVSLRRYALLLHHAGDSRAAGRRLCRADIRREVGPLEEQFVMWPLLEDPGSAVELALGDRAGLERLLTRVRAWAAAGDRKVERLHSLLGDRLPTLVFTCWAETVHHLRAHLGLDGTAWVTGDRSGIDRCRYPRRGVLRAFDPATRPDELPIRRPPWLLLSTDVAAEGLNLHRVGRVVHYDLPWTAVRLDQRDGRALRLGSVHPDVEVIRFDAPPAMEQELDLASRLARKRALPGRVGLSDAVSGSWLWHQALDQEWSGGPAELGCAVAGGSELRAAAAVALDDGSREAVRLVVVRDHSGAWRDDPAGLVAILRSTGRAPAVPAPEGLIASLLDELAPVVRAQVQRANGRRWIGARPDAALSGAFRVAHRRLDRARTRRDPDGVAGADRVLAFLGLGHTSGERQVALAVGRGDAQAWEHAARLAPRSEPAGGIVRVRLLGLLVVTGPDVPCPPCDRQSGPCCSTSMGRCSTRFA